jgi:hypothetical protein
MHISFLGFNSLILIKNFAFFSVLDNLWTFDILLLEFELVKVRWWNGLLHTVDFLHLFIELSYCQSQSSWTIDFLRSSPFDFDS